MNTEFPTRWRGMARSWMLGNVACQHLLLVLVMYCVNSGWTRSSLAVGLSIFFCSRHLKRMSRIGGERLSGMGGGCIDVAICRGKNVLKLNVLSKSILSKCVLSLYGLSFWKMKDAWRHVIRRLLIDCWRKEAWFSKKKYITLNMSARWFEISFAFQGGLVVAISMITHPTLHTSQALP